ncbi:MAG TPA: hypothetical protein VFD49_20735 [Candidatus Dormibacteraeota bacterium]|nr:hypothetical protein [Candidatus Dormibacteraeota bacterium]
MGHADYKELQRYVRLATEWDLGARLLYAHAKAAGYLYQAHLRYRLSVELRVKWTGVVHGIADVMGCRRR